MLVSTDLKINKKHLNTENNSCLVKNTQYRNPTTVEKEIELSKSTLIKEKLTKIKDTTISTVTFLSLIENNIYNCFTSFSMLELSIIKNKLKTQSIRSQVLDKVYEIIFNTSDLDQKHYNFYTKEVESILNTKIPQFLVSKLEHFELIKEHLEGICRKISSSRREFYFNKMLLLHNSKVKKQHKKDTKELKKQQKNSKVNAGTLKEELLLNDLAFCKKLIAENLPQLAVEDCHPNKKSFLSLLHDFVTIPDFDAFHFIIPVNELYATNREESSNLSIQAKHYIMQIALYISFMKHLGTLYPDIAIDDIIKLREDLVIKDINDNTHILYLIKTVSIHEIYLEIPYTPKQDLSRYVNRFIALLNLMEQFYFNKLWYIYLEIKNNKD